MVKTNVFIIGAQKCGTTSLANYFDLHPEIELIDRKEPHVFSNYFNGADQVAAEINDLYKTNDKKVYVDASTTYSFGDNSEIVSSRIFEYNSKAKIIYIVKDPIDRITSHYNHRIRKNRVNRSMYEDVSANRIYISNSEYYNCIMPYINTFGREKVLILEFDQIKNNLTEKSDELVEFLELQTPFKGKLPNTNRNLEGSLVITQYGAFRKRYLSFFPERVQIFIRNKYFTKSISEKVTPTVETIDFLKKELASDMQKFYDLTGIDYR